MKVVSFTDQQGERVGLLADDRLIDLTTGIKICKALRSDESPVPRTMLDMLDEGFFDVAFFSEVLDFIISHGLTDDLTVDEYRILPPIKRPPIIIALGLNYSTHARESGRDIPDEPIIFGKASTSVIGPDDTILIKKEHGRIDPEVELAVIIGKRAKDVPRENAFEYVAGYTIMNDVTAREIQAKDFRLSQPWFRSKSIDTFAPLGPCVLTKDEVDRPVELDLQLSVNGEIRQSDNTSNLIFGIDYLIEFISGMMTLEPGSIISTGTPEGIAPIYPGDIIEATVEKIGTLKNPVAAYPNGGNEIEL